MAKHGMSLKRINDTLETLCYDGVDIPPEWDGEELITVEGMSDDDLETAIADLMIERDEKLESIGYVLLDMKGERERLKKERQRMDVWIKRLEDREAWLRWYCLEQMIRSGINFVKGAFARVSVRNSPVSAEVNEDWKELPADHIDERFVTEVTEFKIDKRGAIKHFKATGEVPKGFTIHTDKKHLGVS